MGCWKKMTIKRRGKSFYLEVFNPKPGWKFLGKIITINYYGEKKCFATHVKIPEIHFFIKNLGYPLNNELLKMLKTAGIEYILIPERGKRGFKAYIGVIEDYLDGELIHEPLTEEQKSISLKNLDEINIDEKKLIETIRY